jgi:hypothetical protein
MYLRKVCGNRLSRCIFELDFLPENLKKRNSNWLIRSIPGHIAPLSQAGRSKQITDSKAFWNSPEHPSKKAKTLWKRLTGKSFSLYKR